MSVRERIEQAAAAVDGGTSAYLPTVTKAMIHASAREALLIAKERMIDEYADHSLAASTCDVLDSLLTALSDGTQGAETTDDERL